MKIGNRPCPGLRALGGYELRAVLVYALDRAQRPLRVAEMVEFTEGHGFYLGPRPAARLVGSPEPLAS